MKTPMRLLFGAAVMISFAYADPVLDWQCRYNGGGVDSARAMAIDRSGNIYVVGRSDDGAPTADVRLIKVSPAGLLLWERSFGHPSKNDDAYEIKVDGNQNVVVIGTIVPTGGNTDIAVAKYSGSGVQAWLKILNGPGNSTDIPYGLTIDSGGNSYICGKSHATASKFDALVTKLSPSGTTLWSDVYDHLGGDDVFRDIDLNTSSNLVMMAGYFAPSSTGNPSITVASYTTGGTGFANTSYPVANPDFTDTAEIVALPDQQAVFTGSSTGQQSPDIRTLRVKRNPSGQPITGIWGDFYNGPGNGPDDGIGLDMDPAQNSYIAGNSFSGAASGTGIVVRKFSPGGAIAWTTRFDEAGPADTWTRDIAVDSFGFTYTAGYSLGNAGNNDWVMLKLKQNGDKAWSEKFDGGFGADSTVGIEIRATGELIVVGNSRGAGNDDFLIRKYVQAPTANNDSYPMGEGTTYTISDAEGVRANDFDASGTNVVLVSDAQQGTLTLGAAGNFTYQPDQGFTGTDSFTYKLVRGNLSSATATVSLLVGPIGPAKLTIAPTTILGGRKAVGTISTLGPAPAGGITFDVSDDSSALSTPATATMAAGSTTATFQVSSIPVTTTVTRSVTVSRTGTASKTANVTLTPGGLAGFYMYPYYHSVTGGVLMDFINLTLTGPAPAGGISVNLSTNSSSMTISPTVSFFPETEQAQPVSVQTPVVTNQLVRMLIAEWEGITRTTNVILNPKDLMSSLVLNPSTVKGGESSVGTLTLKKPAPIGGLTILIDKQDPYQSTIAPASFFIPAGSISGSFTLTTKVQTVASTGATIRCVAGESLTKGLTVTQ